MRNYFINQDENLKFTLPPVEPLTMLPDRTRLPPTKLLHRQED
jgi:hypothetical protein